MKKVIVLAAAGLTFASGVPAQAKEAPQGVKVTSLWQYLGTFAYISCLRKQVDKVAADAAVTEAAIAHAHVACADAGAKAFSTATMGGGTFPTKFTGEAQAMGPASEAYVFGYLRRLPPSDKSLQDRIGIFVVFPDGSVRDAEGKEEMKLAKVDYVILRAKD